MIRSFRRTSLLQLFYVVFILINTLYLSACGNSNLQVTTSNIGITGTIDVPTGTFTVSKVSSILSHPIEYLTTPSSKGVSAFSCDISEVTLEVYKIGADGTRSGSALAAGTLTSTNGSFKINADQSLVKEINNSTKISYVLDAVGCSGELLYSRPLTSTKNQDVTPISSFIGVIMELDQTNRLKLTSATPAQIQDFIAEAAQSLGAQSSVYAFYQNLSAHNALKQKFLDLFGFTVNDLLYVTPRVLHTRLPTIAQELVPTDFISLAKHWNPNYQIFYEWKIDGVSVATANQFEYTASANSQGTHTLDLYIGRDDGTGQLDTSKVYVHKSATLLITNNVHATPPTMKISGALPLKLLSRNINIAIDTGPDLANCDSFSKLAITETSTAPTNPGLYTITCTTDTEQIEPYTLVSSGDGAKTLYLWAMDAANNISPAPSTLNVVLLGTTDSTLSTISASPSTNIPSDGTTYSFVTVTLKDALSHTIPGKVVSITSSRGATDTITAVRSTTNALGEAVFKVSSSTLGTATLTATNTTDAVTLIATQNITFTSNILSASNSTLAKNISSVTADGTSTATLTLTLKDLSNNPLPGRSVTLISDRGTDDTISPASATTDSNGEAVFTVKSLVVGNSVFSGKDQADGIVINQTQTINFKAGAISLSLSSLTLEQNVLDPGQTTRLLLTLRDSYSHLIEDTSKASSLSATLLASGTSMGTFTAFTAVSGSPGVFASTFTASTGGTANTARVYFQDLGAFSTSLSLTVLPRLLTLSGPNSVVIGACSTQFVVTHRNDSGVALNVSENKDVTFANVGQGAIYSDSGCTIPVNKITIAKNSSSKPFYFKDLAKETVGLTAKSAGTTSGTAIIQVTGAPTSAIRLIGSSPLPINTCSPAVNITFLDTLKNPTAVTTDTTVNLAVNDAVTLYSDSACTTSISNVTVLSGQTSGRFYLKSSKSESYTLTGSSSGLSSGNYVFSVLPSSPVRIAVEGPGTVTAGVCHQIPFTFTVVDEKNNPTPVSTITTVTLSGRGSGVFYSTSACSNAASTFNINPNASSYVPFYFKSNVADSLIINVTAPGLAGATHPLVVQPAAIAKLRLSGPNPSYLNGCNAFTVNTVDGTSTSGNPQNVSSDVTVNLGGFGTGAFYSDSGCTTPLSGNAITILNGTNSATYYFKPIAAVSHTLTAADAANVITAATNLATVVRTYGLKLTGPQNLTPGACSSAYTINSVDGSGALANVASNVTVTFGGKGSGVAYSDSSCLTPSTSLVIANGTNSLTFYFKDTVNESLNFSMAATNYVTGTLAVSVGAMKMELSGTSSVPANSCNAYTLTTKDSTGTPVNVAADTTFSLIGAKSGAFYSDAGCTSAITSLIVTNGTSSKTVYYKNAVAEQMTLQAVSTGYTGGSFLLATTPLSPAKLHIVGPSNITESICSAPYTLHAIDAQENVVSTIGAQIDANLVSSGSTLFYSDAACTSAIATLSLTNASPTKNFYIKNTAREGFAIETTSTYPSNQLRILAAAEVDDVVAGNTHTCALTKGEVKCWGQNQFGQLGNASLIDSAEPVAARGLTGVTKISAGGSTTCAILQTGALKCWGSNSSGQIGNNSLVSQTTPTQVIGLTSGVTDVSVGGVNTCAIQNGDVYCWGSNVYGQVGNGSSTDMRVPTLVNGLSGATQVAAGLRNACALVAGSLKCWGYGTVGTIGNGLTSNASTPRQVTGLTSNVVSIPKTASAIHMCAIATISGGDVALCWGEGSNGRIGQGSSSNQLTPFQLTNWTSGVTHMAINNYGSCAIINGSLSCWGYNITGAVGNGSTNTASTPRQVVGLTEGVTAVAAGRDHTCAVVRGQVACWGSNAYGQLGTGLLSQTAAPIQVAGLTSGVSEVQVGTNHVCARLNDEVKCWGGNASGQVGNGTTTSYSTPTAVSTLTSGSLTSAVKTGSSFSCAIVNGAVKCWGLANVGQLGNAIASNQLTPGIDVNGLSSGVTDLSVGITHSCAIQNGSVKCWGNNTNSQLGNLSTINQFIPVQVSGLTSGATFVSVGSQHSCALVGGVVKCWGLNTSGQLGNNSFADSAAPVNVSGLSSVTQLSSGAFHTCAISNGALKCWGDNSSGQLGHNSVVSKSVPTLVQGFTSGVTHVVAGSNYTCAVKSGAAYCWGANAKGQLGTTASMQSLVPLSVEGLESGVSSISASKESYTTCALLTNGSVSCWGLNTFGQLGTGSVFANFTTTPNFTLPLDESQSSLPYDVTGDSLGKIVISGPLTSFPAKTCSGNITISLKDSFGNASTVTEDTPLSISGLGSGQLFYDSNCESPVDLTDLAISASTSSIVLNYKNELSESISLVASIEGYDAAYFQINVDPANTLTLAFSNSLTLNAGVCSAAFTLNSLDSNNAAYTLTSPLAVTVSGLQNGALYSDPSCTPSSQVLGFTMASGTSSKTLYYKNLMAESASLNPVALGFNGVKSTFLTTAASPTKLSVRGPGFSRIGACAGYFSITARDPYGGQSTVPSTTTVSLTNTGGGKFYSDSTCTSEITTIDIESGRHSSDYFFMRTTQPDSQLLIASASGFTSELFPVQTVTNVAHVLAMSGPSSVSTGSCSSAITITAQDEFGYPTAQQKAAINTTLSNRGSATTYAASDCSGANSTAVTIPLGLYSQTFYLKDNVAEALTLVSSAADLVSGTHAITTQASTAGKLALSGASTLINGGCGAYVVTAQDANGNRTNVSSTTTITATGQGAGNFYSDSGCTTINSTVVIASGTSSQTYYFKSASNASYTFSATDNAASLTAAANLTVAVRASRLVIAGPTNLTPGVCSSAYTVTNTNLAGSATNVASNTTVTLAGNGSGTFYSDSGCTTSATTVVINSGTSAQTFYYKNTANEFLTLSATATSIAIGYLPVSVGTMKMVLSGSSSINSGTCSAYTLTTQDGTGVTTNVSVDRTFALVGQGTGLFYSDAACTTAITSVTVTSGTSSKIFYYKNDRTANLTFQASLSGFNSASFNLSVVAQAATKMLIAGPSQVPASACSAAFVVTPTDVNNNAKVFPSTTTISLSGGGAGVFYSNANCTTPTSTLNVTAGASNATFYYRNANSNLTLTLSVADGNAALSDATKTVYTNADVALISAGLTFVCAVKSGAVYCWGLNDNGQAANGRLLSSRPKLVTGAEQDVVSIASGQYHACAVLQNGSVKCWGKNEYGNLGNGTTSATNSPIDISLPGPAVSISAGNVHTCALLVDQTVYCWGYNVYGAIGSSDTANALYPTKVFGLTGVSSIVAGGNFTCAIVNGGVYCWGRNQTGQLGNNTLNTLTTPNLVPSLPEGSGVTSLAANGSTICAVKNGGLLCWGNNSSGQVGDGTTTNALTPFSLPEFPASSGVTSAGLGSTHSCAIQNTALKCWGSNVSGEIGNGLLTSIQKDPTTVISSGVTAVTAGTNFTCALVNGLIKCWGVNTYGQLGNGEQIIFPAANDVYGLGAGSGVTHLIATGSSTCVIVNGGVKCWGNNNYGQLGVGNTVNSPYPADVTNLGPASGVTQIDGAGDFMCAIVTGDGVKCWGRNYAGAVGNDTSAANALTPVSVVGLPSTTVTQIATSIFTSCALVNGGVYCWGFGLEGGLGNGETTSRTSAVPVPSLPQGSGVTSIYAGYKHFCAVLADGSAKCWGANGTGQLGDGTRILRSTPVDLLGLERPITHMSLGVYASCALLDDGSVKCWGANSAGYLGNGILTSSYTPVDPNGLNSNVTTLTERSYTTFCAVQNSAAKCWGYNLYGNAGNDSTNYLLTPTLIPELSSGVTKISAGTRHTCALINGGVKCFGANMQGQLGNGYLTPPVTTPSFVVPF